MKIEFWDKNGYLRDWVVDVMIVCWITVCAVLIAISSCEGGVL